LELLGAIARLPLFSRPNVDAIYGTLVKAHLQEEEETVQQVEEEEKKKRDKGIF
jgi:hypothetical protein